MPQIEGAGGGDIVRQRTLKTSIHCTGVGLHHGSRATMTLRPAPADSGIHFRRTDIAGGNTVIRADWRNVVEAPLCTAIGDGNGVTIATVEHLLAALAGCGIDNLLIEINGPEVPIMDGSAWPFVFLAECAGIAEQPARRQAIRVLKPVVVGDGHRRAGLTPGDGFSVSFAIDYDAPAVARQECLVPFAEGVFKAQISRARTYGFLHEVDALRAAGLARGASLDNAVLVNGHEVLNSGGLRYRDEFVRHKVLDAIGDLYLAGAPLLGRFQGHCSGHRLNQRLLQALFADPQAWTREPMMAADLRLPATPATAAVATA